MEMKPRQSLECELSSMCETTFGKEIKPSTKVGVAIRVRVLGSCRVKS